ncbi:hypothetical protein DLI66_02910 [Acinetobacter baumannii]|nr:hypothetical protein [Acinetobacter baumannii]EKU2474720.1 hypothetical protein [Acinetobacter baumannii]KAA8947474.1 hypothetical protein DLI66_02910 [Acinetobacter baumannii]MEE1856024.1 hypothetical protein [Acinetobacter baumannii]NDX83840.1 hypothetical protein [Acinetobacter baumannii]
MKNTMKQIEKYVGYYFLAYLFVLILCGFFQYFTVCQGKSLECNFSIGGINKILTTTATVLTPIIAIIGYLSWRNQETYKKSQELIDLCIDKIRDLQISWHESREYGEVSRFQYYLARGILGTENLDDVKLFHNELEKNNKNIKLLDDLVFLIDKLYHEIKNDFTALENAIDNVEYMLNKNLEDLLVFHQQLVIIKYGDNFTLKSENEMREICKRLDRYCDQFMGGNKDDIKYDYKNDINESLLKISKEILKIKKEI